MMMTFVYHSSIYESSWPGVHKSYSDVYALRNSVVRYLKSQRR